MVAAVTFMVQGNRDDDIAEIRGGGFILLFAFTYLWVAANDFLNAGGRALRLVLPVRGDHRGPGRASTRSTTRTATTRSIYLGIDWFAWAVLWFLFFVLLALDRPIARIAGGVAILEGIGTAWVFGLLLLLEQLSF